MAEDAAEMAAAEVEGWEGGEEADAEALRGAAVVVAEVVAEAEVMEDAGTVAVGEGAAAAASEAWAAADEGGALG